DLDTRTISTTMALLPSQDLMSWPVDFLVASTIRLPPYSLIGRSLVRCGLKLGGERHDVLLGGVLAVDEAGDAAVAHDHDPVGHTDDLAHFGGDHDDALAGFGQFGDDTVDLILGADVDAAGGLIQDQ